jgi:hypothetical protein
LHRVEFPMNEVLEIVMPADFGTVDL